MKDWAGAEFLRRRGGYRGRARRTRRSRRPRCGRRRGGGRGFAFASGDLDDQDQLMYAPTVLPRRRCRRRRARGHRRRQPGSRRHRLRPAARANGARQRPRRESRRLVDSPGQRQPVAARQRAATAASANNYGGRVGWDGQFSIANVPPGLYTLRARNNDRDAPLSTSQPLSVSNGDVSDVVVVLQTGGSLSGTLAFQPGSTSPPTDLTQVRISAPSTEPDDNTGPTPNPRVNKDGTFTIDGVSVGSSSVPSEWRRRPARLEPEVGDDRRPRRHRHRRSRSGAARRSTTS